MGETVHVVPIDDLMEYSEDGDVCGCGPHVEFVEGGKVIVHHSLDGREKDEPDWRHGPLE